MDKDRFRRRADYSSPVRRPATPPPVVDGIDQARPQANSVAPQQPAQQPQPMVAQQVPQTPPAPVVSAPRPMSEQTSAPRQWTPSTGVQATPAVASESTAGAPTTIAVNISLPKLSKPKVKLPKPSKKVVVITLIVIVSVALIAGGVFATSKLIHHTPQSALNGGDKLKTAVAGSPTYTPVVPETKSELASTKTAGTGFDGTRDTYSYQDSISGLAFTVSQQPMPSDNATPQAKIDKIAKAIGGTTVVKIPNGTKGYISGDVKSGNQVIVFTLHNLLVFIQSPFSHPPSDWETYIATLK